MQLLGFALTFVSKTRVGILANRILPRNFGLLVAGIALTWVGIGLAMWARWHLGQYWSGRVTLKEGHQLIRSGPYAHFRHPIYSGLDLAALGAALAFDEWGCVLGVACIVVAHWVKAKREERLLATQFGEAFQEHSRSTGFLFPKF
jgi:protein-S-isoprenylcysteine O-methyltransferase Ste14